MNSLQIHRQTHALLYHMIDSFEKVSAQNKVGVVALAIFCVIAVCYTTYKCWPRNKVVQPSQLLETNIPKVRQNSPDLMQMGEPCALDQVLIEPESPKEAPDLLDLPEKTRTHELDSDQAHRIDEKAIFKKLKNITVQIQGDERKGSGAIVEHAIKGVLLVTEKHVAHSGGIAYAGQQEIDLEECQKFQSGSQALFILDGLKETLIPLPMLTDCKLEIGDIVYFGGYPFNETEVHLHRGRVSSIGKGGKIKIDGTAVPGMSGGPIVFSLKDNLYVIGTIASETFDPIDGFVSALDKLYNDQSEIDIRHEDADIHRREIAETIRGSAVFTKVVRGTLYNAALDEHSRTDPDFFIKIWDDLNAHGVIEDDGTLHPEKVKRGQLGLRQEFQQYEAEIIAPLKARIRNLSIGSSHIELPYESEKPTDALNTVGLSLVQSLSTGIISGFLFQTPDFQNSSEAVSDFRKKKSDLVTMSEPSSFDQESSEFEIGKQKRLAKTKQKQQQKAQQLRAEAKQDDRFENRGLPPILYRFVSKDDAKEIKKNGIVHIGSEMDEIPFITKPNKKMAQSVGARSIDKLVTIYTDKIPDLAADNIDTMSQRSGVVVYKINKTIPPDALEVSEA